MPRRRPVFFFPKRRKHSLGGAVELQRKAIPTNSSWAEISAFFIWHEYLRRSYPCFRRSYPGLRRSYPYPAVGYWMGTFFSQKQSRQKLLPNEFVGILWKLQLFRKFAFFDLESAGNAEKFQKISKAKSHYTLPFNSPAPLLKKTSKFPYAWQQGALSSAALAVFSRPHQRWSRSKALPKTCRCSHMIAWASGANEDVDPVVVFLTKRGGTEEAKEGLEKGSGTLIWQIFRHQKGLFWLFSGIL